MKNRSMGFMLAGYWTHNLDPFLIRFPEGFPLPGIRWYGVAYLAGFLAAWWLLRKLAARERLGGVRPAEVSDLVFWAAVGAVLGGRIGYAILYNLHTTVTQPWTLFEVWHGGMASHGGITGVTVALIWWWSRRTEALGLSGGEAAIAAEPEEEPANDRESLSQLSPSGDPTSNSSAPALAPNSSSPAEGTASRVTAPRARKRRHGRTPPRKEPDRRRSANGSPREKHPAAPQAPFWKRWMATVKTLNFWRMGDGVVAVTPVGLFFGRIANFINGELWGRPTKVPWAIIFPESPPVLLPGHPLQIVPRHPSALYEAFLEGIVLFVWLFPGVYRGKWKAGGAVGRFVLGYAAVRFIAEFFRAPDEGIGYQWLHLTRGQWLSILMAAIGLGLLKWLKTIRRNANELGGVDS